MPAPMASGMYIYQVKAGEYTATKKLMLLRVAGGRVEGKQTYAELTRKKSTHGSQVLWISMRSSMPFSAAINQDIDDLNLYRVLFWNDALSADEIILFGEKLARNFRA